MMGSFSKHHAIHWHQRMGSSGSRNAAVTSSDGFIIICACCAPRHTGISPFQRIRHLKLPQCEMLARAVTGRLLAMGQVSLCCLCFYDILQCFCTLHPDACLWKGEKSSSSADVFWGSCHIYAAHRKSKHQKKHPTLPHSPL